MLINPLRYPGSKSAFYRDFRGLFVEMGLTGKQFVEPYAGSASLSLNLLNDGLVNSVMLFERDPLVFCFWYALFKDTDRFLLEIEKVDVTLDRWHKLQPLLKVDTPERDQIIPLALACLFFNRANFSGVLHAGPIGGQSQSSDYSIDCRFNRKELIRRMRAIALLGDRVDIYFGDALRALADASNVDNSDRVFYVDPPYFRQGKKLYRYFYSLSQHRQLSTVLREAPFDWILSYDKHHVIEFLYEGFNRLDRRFQYSANRPKKVTELLITNMPAPEGEASTRSNVVLNRTKFTEASAIVLNGRSSQ